MAVRTSWSGTISFGLVSVPVGTCGAVTERDVKFSQFHEVDGALNPVGRKDYDKATGETVTRDQVTRCYVQDGVPVPVTDEELAALAPLASKSIEIEEFIDESSVDPVFFARHEYAVPAKGAEKAYALLYAALAQTGKAGVARTVRRSKQHVVLVRAVNGALCLTFLNYADEIRDTADLGLSDQEVKDAELAMAVSLVEALAGEWQPERLVDGQRERVLDLIAAKASGHVAPVVDLPAVRDTTADLMAALAASVAAAKAS